MSDLSSLTSDQLAEKVRDYWGGMQAPQLVMAPVLELVSRLKTAEDALADEKFLTELMTAQRDEAFKHLTTEQQHECIRAACRTVQPLAVDHFSAALLASPDPNHTT